MLLVRVDECAKHAAPHEISDQSWSWHKGRDIKSQAMSVPERLCCNLNSWEEIRPTISNPKPGRNPSSPLRLPLMWRRNGESAKHWCGKTSPRPKAVSRSNAASPNFRTSPLSAQRTQSRIKLKNEPVYCRRNIVHARRAATALGPPAEGRSVPSKILEWMRALLLRQSALLGRPGCNESSQTKRDLLAAPGEPAQATLSGSPLPEIRVRSTSAQRVGERFSAEKVGATLADETLISSSFFFVVIFCQSASIPTSIGELSTGDVFTGICSQASPGQDSLCETRGKPSTPTRPSYCQIISEKTRLHAEFYDSEKQRGVNL